MNVRHIGTPALAMLLILTSTPVLSKPPLGDTLNEQTVVAKVGGRTVTREDIIHMIQIEKHYKSPPLSEADALVIILQDAIVLEVAHLVGVEVIPLEKSMDSPFVDQYTPSSRIDSNTQANLPPDDQAFHVDHASYAQLYVVPKIILRKLRRYFNTAVGLHQAEKSRIEKVFQLVTSGKSFTETASATGLISVRSELDNKVVTIPAELQTKLPATRNYLNPTLFDILDQLSSNAIHPNIIEDEYGYRVLRLIARNGQKYSIETIDLAKVPFETWLNDRAMLLHITISDDTLKQEVKRDYSNLDWVRQL